MIKAVVDITKTSMEDKLKSPFYRNFILWWITWNWKVWYVTFFVSEEILKENKIEYIKNMYTYIDLPVLFPLIWFILEWIIIPFIISWIVIFIVRKKVGHRFLEKSYELEDDELEIKKKYLEKEEEILEKEEEILDKKEEIQEKRETIYNKEWDKEYKELSSKYPDIMKKLGNLIYHMYWFTHSYQRNETWKFEWIRFSSDTEKILDAIGLITFSNKALDEHNKWNVYNITDKWKYFLKKSSLES